MKTALPEHLLRYLETLSGERPDLGPEEAQQLPLFLRERYALYSARLFGQKSLIAVETENWESGSPAEYGKHEETLRQKLGQPVVLVVPFLASHARNRMVQMGIPFIVPGSQAFLPGRMIDLRERFPRPGPKHRGTLTPAAQCTVLYHLLRSRLDRMPLKDIAEKVRIGEVHYSPTMMTKVKDELEAAEICKTTRSGRSTVLEFAAAGRDLWKLVEPRLASPVKKVRWV